MYFIVKHLNDLQKHCNKLPPRGAPEIIIDSMLKNPNNYRNHYKRSCSNEPHLYCKRFKKHPST